MQYASNIKMYKETNNLLKNNKKDKTFVIYAKY